MTSPTWNIQRILVGVDLAQKGKTVPAGSHTAMLQALWIAQHSGAHLTLFHSTRTEAWAEAVNAGEVSGPAPLSPAGKESLDGCLEELRAGGVSCELDLGSDRPWLDITRRAMRGEMELVVVGKRDKEERDGRKLGSVATKLLRKCPGAVWVVKPGHDLSHKLVLAATDLSGVGDRAVRLGVKVADWQEGGLHVVHAYRVPLVLQAQVDHITPEEYESKLETIRNSAQEQISGVVEKEGYAGSLDMHIGRNTAFNGIKEAAEHLRPDLLVMGTISTCSSAGLLVGDTAEKLLTRINSSMLTIKPRDFETPITDA